MTRKTENKTLAPQDLWTALRSSRQAVFQNVTINNFGSPEALAYHGKWDASADAAEAAGLNLRDNLEGLAWMAARGLVAATLRPEIMRQAREADAL